MANSIITLYDDNNTINTTLSPAEVWTGNWSLIPQDHILQINGLVDSVGFLYIEYANEPDVTTHFIDPELGYTIGGLIPEVLIISPAAKFYRLRFLNGAFASNVVEIYPYFTRSSLPRLVPLNKLLGRDENSLSVRPSDSQDDILRGLKSGVSHLNKWGYRDDLDQTDGDGLIIADDATNQPVILTTASTFTITYNSANDGLGTTGALSLSITYLDANQDLQTAVHVLGNDGSDVTAFTGLGINNVIVQSSGSLDANVSNITIAATTGGSVQAFMPAGTSTDQRVLAHIPRNTVATLRYINLSSFKLVGGGTPRVIFKVFVYNRDRQTRYEFFRLRMDTDVENNFSLLDPVGQTIGPNEVIWVAASTSADNTQVSARFSLNLYLRD